MSRVPLFIGCILSIVSSSFALKLAPLPSSGSRHVVVTEHATYGKLLTLPSAYPLAAFMRVLQRRRTFIATATVT